MKPTKQQIKRAADTIAATQFFPSGDGTTFAELCDLLTHIISTAEQCEWLRRVFRDQVSSWPGLAEVRAIFASRFRPADGIEGKGYSAIAGFTPGDIERESLTARETRYLPAPGDAPVGDLSRQIESAAKRLAIPAPGSAKKQETTTA